MQQNNNLSPVDDSSSSAAALATPELILYSFWQSSCSWRVRFALNLKGLLYKYRAVNLAKGEQFSPEFEKLNPLHYVPVLADGDILVSDSLAILLAANIVASSIQPLHMMTFLNYIEEKFGSEERLSWAQSTVEKGLFALEKLLNNYAGKYATGDKLYLADVFLAPQIAIATKRFNIAMFNFPTLSKIFNSYMELPEFIASLPERQPDAIQ